MRVALQMDPMTGIDIEGDSSFALAEEAQARGHTLYHYLPDALTYRHGEVVAHAHPMTVSRKVDTYFRFEEPRTLNLAQDVDVILMRQDPPFDMAYITYTHLLDLVAGQTLVVNNPTHVRNAPEKLFVTEFADLMPETLITRSMDEVRAFRTEHQDIILKPLYGNGGFGVFRLQPGDENLASCMEMFLTRSPEPIMVQRYLPEVRQGDKRIILVDGEPVGALNRVPAQGEARSNMHVGGKPLKSDLTAREREICARLAPALKDRDLIFVGIDVIGGLLTEINVTSPTGLQEIGRYDGVNLAGLIWDAIERR